ERAVPLRIHPRMEVVGDPQGLESGVRRTPGLVDQVPGAELLRRQEVSDAHAHPVPGRIGGMQIGLQIPDFTNPGGPGQLAADLARVARSADELGFRYLAVMDHFFQIQVIGPPEREMLEGYTTLGFLAAQTSRVELLTVMRGSIDRHQRLVSRTATVT